MGSWPTGGDTCLNHGKWLQSQAPPVSEACMIGEISGVNQKLLGQQFLFQNEARQ